MLVRTAPCPSTNVSHDLPPGARLLFAASREPRLDDEELRESTPADIDWALVRLLASQERLMTVAWPRIEGAGLSVPGQHVAAFRMQSLVSEFQLGTTEAVLGEVVEAARELGVEIMLLKGAALALTVYSGFSDRPMGDIDVVARGDDAGRLWAHLREAGWELEFENGDGFYEEHQHLPPLVRGGGIGVVLEVHRSLLSPRAPFDLDEDAFWARSRTIELAGAPVRVFEPEAQLLYLSIHYAWSHALSRGLGRTVRDVAAVIDRSPPDWDDLVALATSARAASTVYWTLRLAQELGDAAVPPEVLQALRPARSQWLLRRLERSFVEASLFRSCPYPRLLEVLWTLAIDPKRSGHGRHRPWGSDEQFRVEVEGGAEVEKTTFIDRLTRIPAGLAYLRSVAAGALGSGSFHTDL